MGGIRNGATSIFILLIAASPAGGASLPADSHRGASVVWAWACLSLLASGLCTQLGGDPRWALPLGFALGTLYPALLLTGSLAYAGRTLPRWLPVVALGVGAGRGMAQLAALPALAHGVGLALEPALVLAAAGVAAPRISMPIWANWR